MNNRFAERTLSILMALILVVGLLSGINLHTYAAESGTTPAGGTVKAQATTDTVLAFTSDTHNKSDRTASNRLGDWLALMKTRYGHVDYMAFGGDMANASASQSDFWTLTQADMDEVTKAGVTGIYTTGNHEYSPGSYSHDKNETTKKYLEDQEAVEGSNFHIYCLGSAGSSWNKYSSSQVTTLRNYLTGLDDDKPVIIITHYPLHSYGSRTISGAYDIITVLNDFAKTGKKIVYLWGHNHTESDTNYDEIFAPDRTLTYSSGSSEKIQFYYGAAGCMSDSEYGGGSASVKGKGLIITINDENKLTFTYYDASGNDVTEGGTYTEKDPVPLESAKLTDKAGQPIPATGIEVEARRSIQLKYAVEPEDGTVRSVTWESKDTSIATVDSNGKVKGVSEGTTTITATLSDGISRGVVTASITVNVVPNTGAGSDVFELADSLEDGEDYLIVNTSAAGSAYALKNPGGSSGGTAIANSSNKTAVTIEDDTIETEDEDIVWTATANGSGFNLTNNGGYLEGSSSAVSVFSPQKNSDRYWTYNSSKQLQHKGGSSTYTLRYSSSNNYFQGSTSSSSSYTVYLFKRAAAKPNPTSITVTPSTLELAAGKTSKLTVSASPSNANKKVTWKSSDETKVKVDSSGNVTAVAEGNAVITATSAADSSKTATCTVTVTPSTDSRYELATALEDGEVYLIVNTSTAGSAYALKNPGGSSSGTAIASTSNKAAVTIQSGDYILADDDTIEWTASANGEGFNLTNDGGYLEGSSSAVSVFKPQKNSDRYWTYNSSSQLQHKGGSSTYTLRYSSSNNYFQGSTSSSSSYTVYLYKKVTQKEAPKSITVEPKTLTLTAGDTASLTVTPSPANADKKVTWKSSNTAAATVSDTGLVTAIAEGNATITATSTADPSVSGTCTVTVKAAKTVEYVLAETLEADKDYLIANGKDGSVYILSNEADGSKKLKGIAANVTGGRITINENVEAKTAFTSEGRTSTSGTFSAWLANGGKYLYSDSSDGLRMVDSSTQGSSSNSSKVWHYRADGKNLLWFFKDTSSSDGYTDTSSTYKYYLECSSGSFTDAHVSTTSLGNTDTPPMYLFEKDDGSTVRYSVTLPDIFTGANSVKEGKTYTFTRASDADDYDYGDVSYTMGGGASRTVTPDESGTYTIANVTGNLVITGTRTPKPTETYELVSSLTDGGEYLIVNTDSAGSAYALKNPGKTGTNIANSAYKTEVTIKSDKIIETRAQDIVWTAATNGSGFNLKNNGLFIEGSGGNVGVYSSLQNSDRYWSYNSSSQLQHNGGSSTYTLRYSSSNNYFQGSTSSSSSYTVYLFKKKSGDTTHTHTYGNPSYAWASDNSTCTATATCTGCSEGTAGHSITETANASYSVATAATCTAAGTGRYTAEFTNSKFTKQTKDVTIAAAGHSYGTPGYTWASDNSTCTATVTCSACAEGTDGHSITETVNTSYSVTTAATCTAAGTGRYTATFSNTRFTTQTADTTIAALGHSWGEWTVTTPATETTEGVETRTCSRCSEKETRSIPVTGHEHKLSHVAAKAATCTAAGNTEYWICDQGDTACGKYFSDAAGTTEIQAADTVIAALGHSWGEWTVTTPATETTEGVETRTCSRCSEKETRSIPATGHEHKLSHVEAKAATCTESGNTEYWICDQGDTACGKYFSDAAGTTEIQAADTAIAALGHSWGEWTVTTPATEDTAGVETRTCSRCSEKETRSIPATGHAHKLSHVEAKAATCTESGNTEYWICDQGDYACGRYFSDSAGTTEIQAEDTVIAALGHSWGEWTETTPATETTEGVETRTCSRCSEKETRSIPVIGHIHELTHVEAKNATCTAAGNTEYWICDQGDTACGRYFSDAAGTQEIEADSVAIAALGHSWGEWTVTTPATEDVTGVETRTCSRCSEKETRSIPATGHTHKLSHVAAKAATCTAAGNTEYWICDQGDHACGRYFSDAAGTSEIQAAATVTAALGHSWGEWTVTKAATTKEEGVKTRTCLRCGEKETASIPKLDPEPSTEPSKEETPGQDTKRDTKEDTSMNSGSDPSVKGKDGTAVGEGASAAAAEKAITSMSDDKDPAGAVFGKLTLRSPKQTKTSIKLSWTKTAGAEKYVIYGNKCGKTKKPKKLYTVTGNTKTIKKAAGKKLKKGTYYKLIVVALNKDNMVVSTSKLIHVATKGGKYGNDKKVTVKKSVINKAKKLKVGKSLKVNAKAVAQSKKLKVQKHVAVRYESMDSSIATVTKKGVIKARKKGTCTVYAYAQNGVFKKIKVVVK